MSEHVDRYFPAGTNPFGEVHICMAAAARRDLAALAASRARMERLLGEGLLGAQAAVEWSFALQALIEGNGPAADAHFDICESEAIRLGGSNAQRSIIGATRQGKTFPGST